MDDRLGETVTGTRITVTPEFADGSSASKAVELGTGEHGFGINATLLDQ